ncbi:hypothetical protein Hdeb2414_s0007g00226111 [Helianthus debilis subsp. tardiflorus]
MFIVGSKTQTMILIFSSGMGSMGLPKRIKLMSLVLDMLIISKQDIYQECGVYYDVCFNNSKSVHLGQNLQVLNYKACNLFFLVLAYDFYPYLNISFDIMLMLQMQLLDQDVNSCGNNEKAADKRYQVLGVLFHDSIAMP